MLRKTYVLTGLAAAVFLGAVVLLTSFITRYRTRQRVNWWLDHSYDKHTNLAHPRNYYFASYRDWSEAGQSIPGIESALLAMYKHSSSEGTRVRLLYAIGAVPMPETFDFLVGVAMSATNPEIRRAALYDGLMPNSAEPAVQQAVLAFVKDPEFPLEDRCYLLAELLYLKNKDACSYARCHGRALLAAADAGGVAAVYAGLLAKQMMPVSSYPTRPGD